MCIIRNTIGYTVLVFFFVFVGMCLGRRWWSINVKGRWTFFSFFGVNSAFDSVDVKDIDGSCAISLTIFRCRLPIGIFMFFKDAPELL